MLPPRTFSIKLLSSFLPLLFSFLSFLLPLLVFWTFVLFPPSLCGSRNLFRSWLLIFGDRWGGHAVYRLHYPRGRIHAARPISPLCFACSRDFVHLLRQHGRACATQHVIGVGWFFVVLAILHLAIFLRTQNQVSATMKCIRPNLHFLGQPDFGQSIATLKSIVPNKI